ncbi:MAG: putative peptide transporter substrate-binding protein [Ilumatobacteraceae bacterium]|nr:putative peptide transporter substrate-binding protein [Ilumatobacteraceae bacterium]
MDDSNNRVPRTSNDISTDLSPDGPWLGTSFNRRRMLQYGAGIMGAVWLAACSSDSKSADTTAAPTTTAGSTTTAGTTPASSAPVETTGTTTAGSTASTGAPDTTVAATDTTLAETTTTAAAAVDNDPTAILKFGAMRGTSYDPMVVGTQTEYPQLNVIFDTLVSTDPITNEFLPRIATAWDIQDDRIRFTLRDGITFQDGTPLDATAVKFSIDRTLKDPASNITTRVPMLGSVEVVDAKTVDLVMAMPQPVPLMLQLADRTGMIVSPTAVQAAGSSQAFSAKPVGAGMYKIDGDWFPRESMSVRAWDGYWDKDAARLGGIDFNEVAMAAQLNALRAGEEDMGSYQGADADSIKGQDNLRLKIGYAPLIKGLVININIAPFDNIKVRQAIAYAIDRDAAVQALTFGYGRPAYQMFDQESVGYDPALEGYYKYDVDKAKQLLSDAGFPNGIKFDSIIGSTSAPYVAFGQFLQANLKKAGIDMNLQLVDTSTVISQLYGAGTVASAPIATSGGVADTIIRLSLLNDGGLNAGKIEVPGVRDLVEKAATAKTAAEAKGYYQAISKIQVEGVYAIIPVFNEPAILGYEDYVGGVTRGFADTDISPEMFRGIYITNGKKSLPAT